MRNQSVAGLVSELSPLLMTLVRERRTLERDALYLAEEALSCINIYEPTNNTVLLRGVE
jgi:hypothetical protein